MSAETEIDRRFDSTSGAAGQGQDDGLRAASGDSALRAEPRVGQQSRRDTRAVDEGDEEVPTRARRPRRRHKWRSPLTRRILALNVLVLLIPVLGLLHLDQYRESLIQSSQEALRTQGHAFSLSLGSAAAVSTEEGQEQLVPEITRALMRVLFSGTGVRARIFSREGDLIADSYVLEGPGGQVQVIELPPLDTGSPLSAMGRLYDRLFDWLPGLGDLPIYEESPTQRGDDYEEVGAALLGDSPGVVRLDRDGHLVLSVAVPIQRYRQILGALLLTKGGQEIMLEVRDRRRDILMVFGIALAVTVLLSLYLAGTIARPIRRLAEAADQVRYGKGRKFEIPDFSKRDDEIGDLSGALRAMTEALWARLDAIEGFAADVAHEIKNPLTSLRSAVETVARVEDPEQQKKLMSIILDDIQRMDRLISDISDASRLDAELSRAVGARVDLGRLLDALVEAQRTTLNDDGPRFHLERAGNQRLAISGLEERLGQVFRNLLSNAVSFSPPGGNIWLAARREAGWVVVTVSDEGPGMPEDKLDNIFDRFYSERPKGEKFGTHSGLGLSISRQIIEAHGGTIRAENRHGEDGQVIGAHFVVRLPAE